MHVQVTRHAEDQARKRWPEEWGAIPRSDLLNRISQEVNYGVADGRMATNCPRWAIRDGTTRRSDARYQGDGRRAQALRFVWNRPGSRLYVIRRRRKNGKQLAVILTVWKPDGKPPEKEDS